MGDHTDDLARTDAQERIWVDFAESPSGALIGSVYATDLGDIPYILATPTALAASPEVQALLAAEKARADAAEALVAGLRAGLLSVCEYEPDERDNPLVVIMRMARLARAALGGWMPPDGSVMVPIPIRLAKEFRDRVADEMAAWPDDTAYQDDLRAFASALDAALLPPAPEGEAQREEARKG